MALALLLLRPGDASAATFRWANDNAVRSLDPYVAREEFLRSFDANIYEGLVRRGRDLAIEPALAQRWSMLAPDRWRFVLRQGAMWQDGTPFTADDVVFSLGRARAPGSRIAPILAAVQDLRAIDDHTIELETTGPDPLLLDALSQWPIMSRAWCEAHDASDPADLAHNAAGYANDHANGTGPFALEARDPDGRTVLAANPRWWDKREHDLDRAVFTPYDDPNAMVAALESGALDMIYDVPPQSVDRIARDPGLAIVEGPELRTILLGFDERRDQLVDSSVTGRNPFKDRRVREAVSLAIDERAIVAKVMRGHATPAGLIVGPGVEGFDPARNARAPYDPAHAKRLLAEAGLAQGFAFGMDCPNDRYVNDAAICEEVVAMLARVGLRAKLHTQSRADFFQAIMPPTGPSSFYLVGSTPAGYDAQSVLTALVATRDPAAHEGAFNVAGYSNPALDQLLARARVETNPAERRALLGRALAIVKDDVVYIPLHRQDVIWATRAGIHLVQRADNSFPLRYVRMP